MSPLSSVGEDVEAGVVERLLDGLAAEVALGGQDEVDAAALDLLGLLGVHRRGRRDLGFQHPDGSTSAAVTMRGGLVDIELLLVEQRQPLAEAAPRARPPCGSGSPTISFGLSPACSFSDAMAASRRRRLLSPSRRLVTRSRALLSSASRRGWTSARYVGQLVGDDPARRLVLGVGEPRQRAGGGGDRARRVRRRSRGRAPDRRA